MTFISLYKRNNSPEVFKKTSNIFIRFMIGKREMVKELRSIMLTFFRK